MLSAAYCLNRARWVATGVWPGNWPALPNTGWNENLEIGYGRGFRDVNEKTLTRSLFFPNTLETPSVAKFRGLKEMTSFHPVRAHKTSY